MSNNNNNTINNDPDEVAIEDINRHYVPLREHECCEDDDDIDPKKRIKLKVYRPPRKEKINSFYILWFYYLNPTYKSKVIDYMNIGPDNVKQQIMDHLFTKQKNHRNKSHHYGFGAHLLQSYYLKIASYPMILPLCVTSKTALRRKFDLLSYYLHNQYITEAHRNDILSIFCCIQKLYHWINRRVFYRKWKKSTIVVNTDLAFNELDPENRNVFILYQQNKRFYFQIQELLRVIRNALSQDFEDNYTVISHNPKNPYNNVFLSNCDLYNFYFHLKYKVQGVIPIFYELWFLEQFDLPQYSHKHELLLKRMCIQNHVRYSTNNNRRMQNDVVGMLTEYESICPWKIDNKFPASMLVQTFRPFLYLYYLFQYEALEYGIMDQYENMLHAKLKEAYAKYPLYGTRKFAVQKYGELPTSAFEMDDNNQIHIVVQEPPTVSTTPTTTPRPQSPVSTLSPAHIGMAPPSSPTTNNTNESISIDDSLRPSIGSIASIVAGNMSRNSGYTVNEDDVQEWLLRFLEIGPDIWSSSSSSSSSSPPSRMVNRSMLYQSTNDTTTATNTATNTDISTETKITEYNVSDIFYTECLAFNSWNIY